MSDTRELETVHGTVGYETVECSSCGAEVAKEDTKTVVIGEVHHFTSRPYQSYVEFEFEAHDYERGRVCQHCQDDPAGYPSGRVFDALATAKAIYTVTTLLLTAGLVAGVLL